MALDTFLRIDHVPGESADSHHQDEIDVLSWTWGVSHTAAATGSGSGSGGGSGKARPADLVVTHRYDQASPLLAKHCAKGTHLASAVLSARRLGTQDFLVITLGQVLVTSVSVAADEAGLVETVSLAYAELQVAYRRQKADGTLGAPVTLDWDVRTGNVG